MISNPPWSPLVVVAVNALFVTTSSSEADCIIESICSPSVIGLLAVGGGVAI